MKDLYLASSFEDLVKLADKDLNRGKPQKLLKSAGKIFQNALTNSNLGDEETAYIMYLRFIKIFDLLLNVEPVRVRNMYSNEYQTSISQLDVLKSSLMSRYAIVQPVQDLIAKLDTNNLITDNKTDQIDDIITMNFPDGFISCTQLYNLLKENIDILVFDVRPAGDYSNSCLKSPRCINIPEDMIQSGYSANILGTKLPESCKPQWDRRRQVQLVVLMDWSSTRDIIAASKVTILKNILLNFDTLQTGPRPPVVLDKGYLEVLQVYPILCKNPAVVHKVQNSVLEDLLDIDAIEYPTCYELSSMSTVSLPEFPAAIEVPSDASVRSMPAHPVVNRATKPAYRRTVSKTPSATPSIASDVKDTVKNDVKKDGPHEGKGDVIIYPTPSAEQGSETWSTLITDYSGDQDSVLSFKAPTLTSKTSETKLDVDDLRARLLKDAREKKKTYGLKESPFQLKNFLPLSPDDRPKRKLRYRPRFISNRLVTEPGTTGLKNYGNTCYMSAVVQCLSNTPDLFEYFIESDYEADIIRTTTRGGEVAKAFGATLQMMWSGQYRCFLPKALRTSINLYTDRYKTREHQDAHEFLILIVDYLHEDLLFDANFPPLQSVCTPREQTWLQHTEGKWSVLVDTFCGQIRNVITCEICSKQCETFDLFQNLTLHLPPTKLATSLEACMDLYFSRQKIQGYECPKCKSSDSNYSKVYPSTIPRVMVIALKRFTPMTVSGSFKYVRNDLTITYPLKMDFFNQTLSLFGVINHMGNHDIGHYTAMCKSPVTKKWHKFDDEKVTEINPEKDFNYIDSYILFYKVNEESP